MKFLKFTLGTSASTFKKNDAHSFSKLRIIERFFLYFIFLVITLMPIINHGCHSSPHTDEELCLDVFKVGKYSNANKKARPIKSGFGVNK